MGDFAQSGFFLDLCLRPGRHRHGYTDRSHTVPKRDRSLVLGHHRLDLPLGFVADPSEKIPLVLFREQIRDERDGAQVGFPGLEERGDLREPADAPDGPGSAHGRGGRVFEVANTVIEERSVAEGDIEPSAIDFVEELEDFDRGYPFLLDEP